MCYGCIFRIYANIKFIEFIIKSLLIEYNNCTKDYVFLLLICEISKVKIEAELQNALRLNSKDKVNYVFEKIYNDYFKLGMFIALQYLNEHDAIEVVDDIFVSFFEKILKEKKNEILNIKQYLCTSIKNSSLRKLKEQRSVLPYNDDIDYQKEEESIYLIETLFAILSNEEQYIIMEHAILDRKFKDIANELNKPLFTVTSIYRRGINKIKRRLS